MSFVKVVRVAIEKLNPAPYNPRKISDRALSGLQSSISRFGMVEPIVWNKLTGNVVGGHQRLKVLQAAGKKEVDVVEVELDDKMEKALNLALNNPKLEGDWTEDVIDLMEHVRMAEDGLADMLRFDELQQIVEKSLLRGQSERSALEENSKHLGVTLFDCRQGEWQRRKDAWISCGLDSGLGRGDNLLGMSNLAKITGMKGQKVGTSIFDPVLCELLYRWYCPEGGMILDPFSGGSVRGIVACILGRHYVGVDIRPEQIEANIAQANLLECDPMPKWIVGDSSNIDELAKDVEADFFFSCPPYFDLEVYSDREEDLSTMKWEAFCDIYRKIIHKGLELLKPNRFACYVIGDIRDDDGFYRKFVNETIESFESGGARFYNEAVLVTAGGTLPMRIRRQFGSYRKLGKSHQNVLVFYKGDPKKIPEVFENTPADAPVMMPGLASQYFKPHVGS